MAVNRKSRTNVAYGIDNALQKLAPQPIVSTRNPTVSDYAEIGTIWTNKASNDFFILTSVTAGSATWTTAATAGSSVAALTVTGGSGNVLTVNAGGNTVLGGTLNVTGAVVLASNLTVTGDTIINGDFDITSGSAITFASTSNTAPAVAFSTNGGPAETMNLTVSQGTSADSLDLTSTAGGIQIQSGLAASSAVNLIAGSGGVQFDAVLTSAWNVIGASADIQLNATGGSISLAATEAAADSISIANPTAGAGIDITAGGAAGADIDIISTAGSVNISGGENIANAISLLAGAGGISIQAVGGSGEPISIQNTNAVTVKSNLNAVEAIYLHVDAGSSETLKLHSQQGSSLSAIDLTATLGGITLTGNTGVSLQSTSGIDIDGGTQVNIASSLFSGEAISINTSQGGILINSAGVVTARSAADTADAIYLHANSGTSEKIRIRAQQGNSTDSIAVVSDVGGVAITSGTSTAITDGGGVGVDTSITNTSGSVLISGGEAAANAVQISAAAGGVSVTTTAAAGVTLSNGTQTAGIYVGTGAPTISAPKGSLYLRSDGSTTTSRMYVNTNAGTTWTAVTTVA